MLGHISNTTEEKGRISPQKETAKKTHWVYVVQPVVFTGTEGYLPGTYRGVRILRYSLGMSFVFRVSIFIMYLKVCFFIEGIVSAFFSFSCKSIN